MKTQNNAQINLFDEIIVDNIVAVEEVQGE